MSQLLDTTIEDLKNGKIKIISKQTFYPETNKKKSFTQTVFLAQHENGSTTRLNKKIKNLYEEILCQSK